MIGAGLAVILCGYLAGSIPTALWLGKALRGIDIREHGSGNAGATNAVRVLGWKAGIFVLIIDMGKGLLATTVLWRIAIQLGGSQSSQIQPVVWQITAGCAAVFGHIFSLFARFRGGKGVGTAAGLFLGLAPWQTALSLLVFAMIVWRTRIVSLGSMIGALSLPVALLVTKYGLGRPIPGITLAFAGALVLIILYTHRANLKRLVQGEEKTIV
ncbi:glycerol-3-phosphate 1-O-acyltransferase PlsY [Sulfidibacter corallicola]